MGAVAKPASGRMKIHTVRGGGGLRLHVREWGREDGPPIVFIHGWSQCHLSWQSQYDSDLAGEYRLVAYDLRGHGMSEAPSAPEPYADGRLWADDLAAVIEELELDDVVLVGWSYGGFVICDYVRAHGQDRVAAIDLAAGAVRLGEAAFGRLLGPGFLDHFAALTADDLPTNVRGMRAFLQGCVATPLAAGEAEMLLAVGMTVPPAIRAAVVAREIDGDDVLRALRVPVLVSHGRADSVVLPAMAEHILATCPAAEASWYDGAGHAPHLEQPERFNRELAALAARVRS
jgi:non-heme chloroperoxidase